MTINVTVSGFPPFVPPTTSPSLPSFVPSTTSPSLPSFVPSTISPSLPSFVPPTTSPSLPSFVPPTTSPSLPSFVPSTTSPSLPSFVPPTTSPSLPSFVPPTTSPSLPSFVPSTTSPSLPSFVPPTTSPSLPSFVPPTTSPSLPSFVPPTTSPSLPSFVPSTTSPSLPSFVPPTTSPSLPSFVPPSTSPSLPSFVPSTTSPSLPSFVPPTTSPSLSPTIATPPAQTCSSFYSCAENNTRCSCDESCSLYGDCCHDVQQLNSTSNISSGNIYNNMLSCVQTSFSDQHGGEKPAYYFMVTTCPQQWVSSHSNQQTAQQILHHCTNSSLSPVTDLTTNLTFRNTYCAQCNNINQTQLVHWNATYFCDTDNRSIVINSLSRIRKYCRISNFSPTVKTRSCNRLVSSCPNTFENQSVIFQCKNNGLEINIEDRVLFKNRWCAECNGAINSECFGLCSPCTVDSPGQFPPPSK